jgi:hypothetical protein
MKVYRFSIKSTSPLMFNKMTEESLEQLLYKSQKKKKQVEERSKQDMARDLLHKDEEGNPLLPLSAVMQAFAKAAGSFKKAKGLGTMKGLAAGAFRLTKEYAHLINPRTGLKHHEWIVDFRRGTNKNADVAVPLVRPKFEEWSASFEVTLDTELISDTMATEILNYAGRVVGVGAWRFEKLGPCGGFIVTGVEEVIV